MNLPDRTVIPDRRTGRRGLVSVIVLIALIVLALVGAALLKAVLARRSEVVREEQSLQAQWMAESALERASSRLAASGSYLGETWKIGPAELGGRGPGSVLIRVEPVPDRPDRRKVAVRADFPSETGRGARRSLEVILPVTTPAR